MAKSQTEKTAAGIAEIAEKIEEAAEKVEKKEKAKRGPNWIIYMITALAAFAISEVISSVIRAQTSDDSKETTIAIRPEHVGMAIGVALILRPLLKNWFVRYLVMGSLGVAADRVVGDKASTAIANLTK